MYGGTLLENIEGRGHLTEREASLVVKHIAIALNCLHCKGKFTYLYSSKIVSWVEYSELVKT